MKKIFLNLLVGALVLNSCSDFLDTASPSQQSSQNVYANEGMTKSAIMGVYAQMMGSYIYGQKISGNWQGVSDIEQASGFFDGHLDQEKTSDTGAANYWCDWYNQTIQWRYIFNMAELASTAVEGIKNSPILESSKAMKQYLGEAMTLRALSYFELVRRYGEIPFKNGTSNSDLSNVYMGKIDRDSIYSCLIHELQEAIEYLPWAGEGEYNVERVTKGYAKGLLARIALFAGGWSVRDGNQFSDKNVEHYPNTENNPGMAEMNGYYVGRPKNWKEYYEIAEQQCAELIGSSESPHSLDPDYGHIWKTVCGLEFNEAGENLFEIAMGMGYTGNIGAIFGRGQDGNIGMGVRGFGSTYACTNAYYFYSFDPEDQRRDYSCYWASYKKDKDKKGKEYIGEVLNMNALQLYLGKWSYWWTPDSYRAYVAAMTDGWPNTGINWIMMRYSDVLLMFAEARYQLGKGTDSFNETAGMSARQALESVRARAFGAGSEKISQYDSDFFMAIVNERAWEFGGESIRKLDLIRWGLLDTKLEEMKHGLCDMMAGTKNVTCMDKIYTPSQLPSTLYYKRNGSFIDWSSVNFYRDLDANPNKDEFYEQRLFGSYRNQTVNDINHTCVKDPSKVLRCASGLRARYDYSDYLSTLPYGDLIAQRNATYKMGNGVCNYRHLYSIYYEDIYRSNGYLKNSYGYDNN